MKPMPRIKQYMTHRPVTVDRNASIHEGVALMKKMGIRHLPVLEKGRLVGLFSERNGVAPGVTVGEAMSEVPFIVRPEAPLDQVVLEMLERKVGSVIVQDEAGEVCGIFTTIDALERLLFHLRGIHWPAMDRQNHL